MKTKRIFAELDLELYKKVRIKAVEKNVTLKDYITNLVIKDVKATKKDTQS